jgi:hypothetical protein
VVGTSFLKAAKMRSRPKAREAEKKRFVKELVLS